MVRVPSSYAIVVYSPGSYAVTVTGTSGSLSHSATVTLAVSVPAPPPSGGLVASLGFNEGSGTTARDGSGNGNNGTILNATWTAAGRYGSGLVFNGSNAWVTIVDSASLHLASGMTLEAWVSPRSPLTGWRSVMLKNVPASCRTPCTETPIRTGQVSRLRPAPIATCAEPRRWP